MNKQRKVLITITYNEMGIIIDTKAEEVAWPNLQPTCDQLATDTISRQAAIDALYDWSEHSMTDAEAWHIKQVIGDIKSLPAVQPDLSSYSDKLWRNAYERGKVEAQAEIVRCKDCKHRPIEKDGEIMPPKEDDWKCPCLCDDYFYSWRPKDNFFCANGERREE